MTWDEVSIPADLADTVEEYRGLLIEAAAEQDDALMEKYFEDPDSLTADEIIAAIRKATIGMEITPLLCGSAFFGVCAHWAEGSLITIDKDLDSTQIYRDLELGIANGGGNMPVFLGTLCEPLVVCPLVRIRTHNRVDVVIHSCSDMGLHGR